jgi:hypothetical protein
MVSQTLPIEKPSQHSFGFGDLPELVPIVVMNSNGTLRDFLRTKTRNLDASRT